MDDLTRIKGVGPSTARALAAAGVDSFAALAAAEPGALMADPAFRGLRTSPADVPEWIRGARALHEEAVGNAANAQAETRDIEAGSAPAAERGPDAAAGEGGGALPTPEPGASGLVVFVRGPRRGRWRIGRFFGPEGREIALDALSEAEKHSLISDPKLVVETRAADEQAAPPTRP